MPAIGLGQGVLALASQEEGRVRKALQGLAEWGERHARAIWLVLLTGWLVAVLLTWRVFFNSNLRGDEYTYVAGARALADAVMGRQPAGFDLAGQLIGTGWFMPGAYLLGTPLFMAMPDASFGLVRTWMLLVNGVLFLGVLALVRRHMGQPLAMVLLVFPGMAPLWHVSAAMHLPDLPAGLLALAAMVLAVPLAGQILRGEQLPWRRLLAMELCLLAALYLRGPMLTVVLALNCPLLVLGLASAKRRWHYGGRVLAGLALVMAGLLPWSLTVSAHFGKPVLTTTNVPLVFADGFGDPARTCFGPCQPGIDIVPAWEFARETAQAQQRNPLDVEREMMRYSIAGLTPRSYFAQAREHVGRFVLDPGGWLRNLMTMSYGIPPDLRQPIYRLLLALTLATYVPFMLMLLASNLLLFRQNDSLRVQAMLVKGVTACLCLQPFVHKSSARYWVALAPLAAWSAVLSWQAWIARPQPAAAGRSMVPRWLDAMQLLYAAVLCAVIAALVLA